MCQFQRRRFDHTSFQPRALFNRFRHSLFDRSLDRGDGDARSIFESCACDGIMTEQEQREEIVTEARTWIGTKFHHRAAVKGAGVDCAYLLHEVFVKVGVSPNVEMRDYPPDWFMHRSEEWFVEDVIRHGLHEIPGPPLRGDVVLFQVGRAYGHGGIVVDWPMVIEAWPMRAAVAEISVLHDPYFNERPRRFFSAWGK